MSSSKRNLLKTLFTANAGSCGCGSPKLSDVYEPEPKPKSKSSATQNTNLCSVSSSASCNNNNGHSATDQNDDVLTSSTSFSFNIDTTSSTLNSESEPDLPRPSKIMLSPSCARIVDSIAVVKDSHDPYQDFRQSMLQMIMEKEIYSRDDLQELLLCFLELNSPCHHDVIVKAFMEIWNQVNSKEIVTVQQEESCAVHGEKHGS